MRSGFILLIIAEAVTCFSYNYASTRIVAAKSTSTLLYSDVSGSPLPTFDDIVKPVSLKAENDQPVAVSSPLVERALDSALDFLQDGDVEDAAEEEDELDMLEIYEESPDFEINYDLIKEYEEKEAALLANKVPSAAEINAVKIKAATDRWRKHDKDVGSTEVQIAICHERVKYLTQHLLQNKKDVAAKRGLDTIVTLRRKLLNYLYSTDQKAAETMVKELGIRFKPPGQLWDKVAKYGAFKNTKSKYLKLRQEERVERKAKALRVLQSTNA